MGPVHNPAAVTIPLQKHSKQKDNTQSKNTQQPQPNKQHAPKTQRGK